ncbi:DUF2567 domain-containing protein [Nocardia iowensis]|uniref:DUF2567 domain-containing protein n=1 Tax=Nocardia iowensis TaxID=204891 RepID=A0ABX8RVT3_NOCIO|nr:DUF2567 domain-containing protein [Nocardia iowensis]QXN93743.1 DUF2567 domain-containing protein [Nocardia iowensis]
MTTPRSGVRREARAAAVIALAVLLVSALGGVLWGLVAPSEQLLVVEPGRGGLLTGESMHQFDGVAMFVCFGAVLGVLSAVAAWRWRAVRGPLLQVGLFAGSVVGAVLMARVGELVAEWHHPRPHDPPVGQIVELPIEVGSWLALIIQPLIASLLVLFLAALSSSEDLGTGTGTGATAETGSFDPAGAFGPYGTASQPAGGAPMPYRSYEPASEAGSGSLPETRPSR